MDPTTAFSIFGALVAAMLLTIAWKIVSHLRRRRFVRDFDFSRLLDERLAKRRPELDGLARQRVFDGLREWFEVCQEAGRRRVSMPSQVVDDAWHEFILFTRNYQVFCRRALGRFLHHVPAEAMQTPTQAGTGLRRTWRICCHRAKINPRAPAALPLLFALDEELGIADGFRYQLDCLAAGGSGRGGQCASHIGCGGGCSSGGSDGGCGGDSGCGGGCGGD